MPDNHDPMRAYRDAALAWERARTDTRNTLTTVGNSLHAFNQYFEPFLVQAFGLPIETTLGMPEVYHLNLSDWPDAAKLRQLVTGWHDAHKRMHEAWARVSDDDRMILKPPPEQMSLG